MKSNTKNTKVKNAKAAAKSSPKGTIIDTRTKAPAKPVKAAVVVPPAISAAVAKATKAAAPAVAAPAVAKIAAPMSPELRFTTEQQSSGVEWFNVQCGASFLKRRVYLWPRKGNGGQVYISYRGYCVLEMNPAGTGLQVPAAWQAQVGPAVTVTAKPAPVIQMPVAPPAAKPAVKSARKVKVA
jgi:hypothetical protein